MTSNSATFELSITRNELLTGSRFFSSQQMISGVPFVLNARYDHKSDQIVMNCQLPECFQCCVLYDGVFATDLFYSYGLKAAERSDKRRCAVFPLNFWTKLDLTAWTDDSSLAIVLAMSVARLTMVDLRIRRADSVSLVIDFKNVFLVPKQKLSAHSSYFQALFSGPNEFYTISDLDPFVFHLILNAIHGHRVNYQDVRENILKTMLSVAEKFQIEEMVFNEFEDYLMTIEEVKSQRWLQVADRYQMQRAVDRIIGAMEPQEIVLVQKSMKRDGKRFSAETMRQIVAKMSVR